MWLAALVAAGAGLAEAGLEIVLGAPRSLAQALWLVPQAAVLYAIAAAALAAVAVRLPGLRRSSRAAAVGAAVCTAVTIVALATIQKSGFGALILVAASLSLGMTTGWAGMRIVSRIPRLAAGSTWLVADALLLSTAAAVAVARFPAEPAAPAPSSGGPSIMLISIDTLRPDHLGAYGYERAHTPRLDRLAAEGIVFEKAIATAPHTLPSHASMLTGRNPPKHGAFGNGIPLPADVPSVAKTLGAEGYRTAAFVSGYPLQREVSGLASHFAEYDDEFAPHPWLCEATLRLRPIRLIDQLLAVRDIEPDRRERPASETADAVVRWLGTTSGRPFFAFVHFYDPHVTYEPPEDFARLHDPDPMPPVDWYHLGDGEREVLMEQDGSLEGMVALYDGEISYVDAEIGRILDRLEKLGVDSSTLVLVTSDHGESLGERGVYFDHDTVHDHLVRVPLIVRLPGGGGAGRRISSQVSLVDLAPTLLELVGSEADPDVEGISLAPMLTEAAAPRPRPAFSFVYRSSGRMDQLGVRDGDTTYILTRAAWRNVHRHPATEELYTSASGAAQEGDLAGEASDVRSRLRSLAESWVSDEPRSVEPIDQDVQEHLRSLGYLD